MLKQQRSHHDSLRAMFCKSSLTWELKLALERLWLRLCSHRVLKARFYKNNNGVLIGKKHDEISSFNQNDFRKGRRVLGSVQKNAYRANERSNGRVFMELIRILGFRYFLQSRQQWKQPSLHRRGLTSNAGHRRYQHVTDDRSQRTQKAIDNWIVTISSLLFLSKHLEMWLKFHPLANWVGHGFWSLIAVESLPINSSLRERTNSFKFP